MIYKFKLNPTLAILQSHLLPATNKNFSIYPTRSAARGLLPSYAILFLPPGRYIYGTGRTRSGVVATAAVAAATILLASAAAVADRDKAPRVGQ